MVQHTKQNTRNLAAQCLDLGNYDAAAMLADLGPQRLKDLPLKGRVVYQTETIPKQPGPQSEVITKWNQYVEKEAEELGKKGVDCVEEDGLGLGGSHRKGPNYRPMPNCIDSGIGPKLPGPARFRAGARGTTSGARRRSPSPSMRDGFLGPKPKNPTFETRPFRGQLVTRHVNTKCLAGFGEASGTAASSAAARQPEPTVTTGMATSKWNTGLFVSSSSPLDSKVTTSATDTTNTNSRISKLVLEVSNVAQTTSKVADVTASTMLSPSQLQGSTASPNLSRSTSRASSIFGPPASPQAKPRWLKSAAASIKSSRSRDTIRLVSEASKNHWNLAPLVLQPAEISNGVTKHEAKSSPLTTVVTTDEAKPQKPQIASTSLQVSLFAEQKPELEPAGQASATFALKNSNASTLIDIPSGQKLGAPSGASPIPSGLSDSKYAKPQVPGLSASKYAGPAPSGLSTSRYATPQLPGLSPSKYATPVTPGISTSRYATNGIDNTRSTVHGAPASPGLAGSKYSYVASPRIASSGALSGLASSKYAPYQLRAAASKEMMKPQNPATHIKTPAVSTKEEEVIEVIGMKGGIKEIADTKNAKENEPVIKTEKGATTLENDVAVQVPMPASQRLLDSIAARYKFASPKQVSGLARRYGTMIVASKDSPTKSIAPQEREIDDATRAFQALFISRGRRVLRQPQLSVSHNMAS
ncbi:hypothetical protein BGX38DRAFT_1150648 [Terfezia claveryi]|nr:hypothetical protein BGX38DRAFT_1150648 [Terfezia claveryi]